MAKNNQRPRVSSAAGVGGNEAKANNASVENAVDTATDVTTALDTDLVTASPIGNALDETPNVEVQVEEMQTTEAPVKKNSTIEFIDHTLAAYRAAMLPGGTASKPEDFGLHNRILGNMVVSVAREPVDKGSRDNFRYILDQIHAFRTADKEAGIRSCFEDAMIFRGFDRIDLNPTERRRIEALFTYLVNTANPETRLQVARSRSKEETKKLIDSEDIMVTLRAVYPSE